MSDPPAAGAASDRLDVLGAWTLGALAFLVFYRLALVKITEGAALDRRLVEKELTVLALDEAEALVRYQFLNRYLCHRAYSVALAERPILQPNPLIRKRRERICRRFFGSTPIAE
jgi:hypothetical protein